MRPWVCAWLLLGACSAARGDAGVVTLRYATPYPPQHPFSRADNAWIEHVQAASHGRLRVQTFWSGSLLSADQSMVELRHGVADVGAIQPIYARGGAHAVRAQAGFYAGALDFTQQVSVYKCLAARHVVLRAELAGLEVLAVQGGNLPGVITRDKPVKRVADLRGLRLRAPSELIEVLHALGADPVNMPMNEVYASLAKGVLDGVIAPADTLRSLHFAEVGRYYAELAIPRGAYPARAIRSAVLARLPAELQRLLRDSSSVWEDALAREVKRASESGRAFGIERGVVFSAVSAADQRSFDEAYNAAAISSARDLRAHGVDGESMFHDARAWITRMRAEGSASAACP